MSEENDEEYGDVGAVEFHFATPDNLPEDLHEFIQMFGQVMSPGEMREMMGHPRTAEQNEMAAEAREGIIEDITTVFVAILEGHNLSTLNNALGMMHKEMHGVWDEEATHKFMTSLANIVTALWTLG